MPSRLMSDLHPFLRPLAQEFLDRCKHAGLDVRAICTWRPSKEQDALYALGRTVKSHVGPWTVARPLGRVVTRARGGESEHNFMLDDLPASLALDVCVFVGGKPVWDESSPLWQEVGRIGQEVGLKWYGAPGAPFREFPHFAHPKARELSERARQAA